MTKPILLEDRGLRAFHNDPAVQGTYIARVEAHRAADEIVQSYGYWKHGKGCAVGCTIHGEDHVVLALEESGGRSVSPLLEGGPEGGPARSHQNAQAIREGVRARRPRGRVSRDPRASVPRSAVRPDPLLRRYMYRGDKITDPALKGARCSAVLQPSGKCISGRSAMLVLFDGEQVARVVMRRQLRKVA